MLDPDAHAQPHELLNAWLEDHLAQSKLQHPAACVLSTIGLDGCPNARYVALKEYRPPYFYITGDLTSRKGRELTANPNVALTFWWEASGRQIRIQGSAVPISKERAEGYFSQRSKSAQIVSALSTQGAALNSGEILEQKINEMLKTHKNTPIEKPDHWGGYKIDPKRVEFMKFKDSRFHTRLLFTKETAGWNAVRLQP